MFSSVPSALRSPLVPLRRALLTAAVLGATAAPASAAVELKQAYLGPVTPGTYCIAEPSDPFFENDHTTFTPGVDMIDRDGFQGPLHLPAIENIQPSRTAGTATDFCVGYRLTPDLATVGRDPNGALRSNSAVTNVRDGLPQPPVDPATEAWTGDDQERVVVDLPAGYLGNVGNTPTCADEDFSPQAFSDPTYVDPDVGGDPTCAANTRIGEVYARASTTYWLALHARGDGWARFDDGFEIWGGAIYNLEPGPNELGRLGLDIPVTGANAPNKLTVSLVLAPDGSGRVRSIVNRSPMSTYLVFPSGPNVGKINKAAKYPIYVESVGLKIFGSKLAHPELDTDFGELGTDCSTGYEPRITVTTRGGAPDAPANELAPVTSTMTGDATPLSGCDQVPFQPSVDVSTTARTPGTPTGVTVKLGLGQTEVAGRKTALLEDAAVTLPAGLELGAQAGTDGLPLCRADEFKAAEQLAPAACPSATKAADVTITTPLLKRTFVGKAYLGEQAAVGELPALYLEAVLEGATAPDAPRIKLVGAVTADAQGRITTTFEDNPQLRFSELRLDFPGGKNALFSTPKTCGTHSATSQLRSYAREELVPASSSLTIDEGCAVPGFAPSVAIAATNPQAGASSPTQITIERADRSPWLDDIKVSLPSGFLADLHVPTECAAAAAAAGNCPASSRIASVSVLSGAGEDPLPLSGQMFLTEREPGAVAGAVIVVRAKIGELDLGDVIVPGRINLRPTDAGLDFITDMPTRFKGLALQLRKVVVDMDREGFALNPSSCGPIGYSAIATGDGGETAAPSGAVAYGGCGNLPFKPNLEARLTGDIKPGGHPGMWVELTKSAGESNLKATTVVLPAGVAADLKNVQSPCARADFDAQRCPASTKVGTVVATVSITPEAIPGDVFLVRVPGETLPGLGLNFTGRFAQQVMSVVKVGKDGRLITRFDAIPDLPLRKLTLQIASGPKGPLQLPPGECAANTRWDATFTGQGGQTATDETGLRCADKSKVRLSDRGGLTLRNFDFGGRSLKSAKVTLPAGWSFNAKRAKYGKHSWARTTGSSTRRKFTRRTMTVTTRGAKASTLRLKVYGTVIAKRTKSKKARTVSIAVRFTFSDGAVQTQTIKVKAR